MSVPGPEAACAARCVRRPLGRRPAGRMSGSGARPSHLSQPVVKSVLVYRNGDPFFAGRRVVIHEKKVSSFDVFLKEVTGGVQAPFGAVRNIYTPRTGHRIRKLDQIQSGGNYVAGGQEAFKKLNYLDIGDIKKRPMEAANTEVKPVIHSRINVSARFRKPLQEPCTIFLIANGDLISPASRLLIPRKALSQWDHVLQMVTEKITLRSGAVHRLYTLEGKLVESGAELENGQFYVAVGRDRFKKLPYSELLFDKSSMRRPYGQKASSLPPIVGSRKSKGSGNDRQSKSTIGSSDNSSPQPLKRKGKKEEGSSGKPTKVKQDIKSQSSPPTVPNNDEGIFKAGAERSEMRGAAEVQEDEDTQVEVPVDQRPAEIVDEEEDGEKMTKEEGQKEDFAGMNGDVEGDGERQVADVPEQVEEIPDTSEEQAAPARVSRGTDEENGEELEPVTSELQPAADEEGKAQGAGNGHEEANTDPQRPPRPEVKITSPQENESNEQSKDYAVVA
ncbi:doublecortin domain-containing protein 2 isoform X2 [Ochotona princeps]|uniref:doublecortin domain-containing protein 2 isoform X2 n=1 Tax=Ochotona princeps TaxID=9978 RepID=UPI002714D12F|nr:doublecortin domain-containing protein 2 isoform X2 [Ochotona princeps]